MGVLFAVQKALDAALSAAVAPVPVFDHTPQGQAFPYLQFGRLIMRPMNLLGSDMSVVTATVTAFSDFRGKEEVETINEAARAGLDNVALVLEAGRAVSCRVVRTLVIQDPDGVTYNGNIDFEILVEH